MPIFDRNGREVIRILDNQGREIETVYDQNGVIVYTNAVTIVGTSPMQFKALGLPLKDYRIYGETLQDGTPSSDMPVDVVGCGVWDSVANSYKLPVTTTKGTDTVTTPIYVGSEPLHRIGEYADYVDYSSGKIVRKIKKLELTGDEAWELNNNFLMFFRKPMEAVSYESVVCTHYICAKSFAEVARATNSIAIITVGIYVNSGSTNVADFKSYLAAQYAAGTPVTVWYVLQEPIEEDPPVPFPELPTLSGINTMSVDTTVKPSQMYIKGKIKPDGYGKLTDKNGVYILDKAGVQLTVHGQGTSN